MQPTFHPNLTVKRLSELVILDPKRDSEVQTGRASWYPYYAGFSEKFAEKLISSAGLNSAAAVIDPWNGSGTTTAAAAGLGHNAFGYDLNPVMVLAARARMLSKREKTSLVPLGQALLKMTVMGGADENDPLATWFTPQSAAAFRSLEQSIQKTLVSVEQLVPLLDARHVQRVSDLAAFFYVALFRTTRGFLSKFCGSNPTWIKKPSSPQQRLRPSVADMDEAFMRQVNEMATAIDGDCFSKDSEVKILVGSSDSIQLPNQSIDFVLSSPPYCTRIDYAVATQPELAVLGYRVADEFDSLRRQLIGTSTVPQVAPQRNEAWGVCCNDFLDKLERHGSKASATYYLKNHLQYFDSIYRSIGEISRTLKSGGACVLVVQDSYYKEIHNDVPAMMVEMSIRQEMRLEHKQSFRHQRTMAGVNPDVRKYRDKVDAVETVLCFSRN